MMLCYDQWRLTVPSAGSDSESLNTAYSVLFGSTTPLPLIYLFALRRLRHCSLSDDRIVHTSSTAIFITARAR
jgi:hypothetical protein